MSERPAESTSVPEVESSGNGASANGTEASSNGAAQQKSIGEVGQTMPADYLAVAKDSLAYDLRVQSIERGGLPDVLVDTAEVQPPGHYGEDSPLRAEMDELIGGVAQHFAQADQNQQQEHDGE